MTGLARVTIEKKNGALGSIETSNDGESLLIVSSYGLKGSEGITPVSTPAPENIISSYDTFEEFALAHTNTDSLDGILFFHHVKQYFQASNSKLHIMQVNKSRTLTALFTDDVDDYITLENYLQEQNGKITLIGVALNPSYVETFVNGVQVGLETAITKAQDFAHKEFMNGRPCQILLEGRGVSFTASNLVDLRSKLAPNVSVVAWQSLDSVLLPPVSGGGGEGDGDGEGGDPLVFITDTAKYAEVGYTLGLISSQPVHRNIGRVRNGKLSYETNIASSSGQLIQGLNQTIRDAVAEKGYIFARKHPQLDGWYISDDPTCVSKNDDYAWITRNRVINKAAVITRQVYNQTILDEVFTDPDTGLLSALTIKNFEADVENAINLEMIRRGEATAVEAYVDPAQDVLTTGEIVIDIRIVPVGVARYITAKIGFSKVI